MPFSFYLSNKVLDHVNHHVAFPSPNTWVALLTTMPSDLNATGLVECSVAGYARQVLDANMGAAASGQDVTTGDIQFGPITADSADIVGFAIIDIGAGAGNWLWWEELNQPIVAEPETFAAASGGSGGDANLAHANVNSVAVKDSTDTTTYVEGTDYYVQYDAGVVVRIAAGAIGAGATVHVSYNYPVTRQFKNGDKFDFAIGSLGSRLVGYK